GQRPRRRWRGQRRAAATRRAPAPAVIPSPSFPLCRRKDAMKIRSVLILTVGLLATPALRADEAKADLEALRGTWVVVSQQRAGRPTERPQDMKWVIDGETVWLVIGKPDAEGKTLPEKLGAPKRGLRMTCRLDPGKSPMQIDLDGPKKS